MTNLKKALITGASSGIGRDMAKILSNMGYDIIAVARRRERLEELKKELKTNVEVVCTDVSDAKECIKLAKRAAEVDVFINNAGFGVFGEFTSSDLDKELKMLDTNVRSVHILTKYVAEEFQKRGWGHIMNVSSMAAFFPGPLFGAYYAGKSYVLRLSQSVAEELRRKKSKVKISVLCPGPIYTEFGDIASVNFGTGEEKLAKLVVKSSDYVAKYAIKKMFSGKRVIVPGKLIKLAIVMRRFVSDKLLASIIYSVQDKKMSVKS